MSQGNQQPAGSGQRPEPGIFGSRVVAILIMVAGAAGFVVTRLVFGDQVLCMLASALVTFLGLGLILYFRRAGGQASTPEQTGRFQPSQRPGTLTQRQIPPGLREEARRRMGQPPSTTPPPWQPAPPPPPTREALRPVPPVPLASNLLDEVIAILQEQGAQVEVETRRADRGILRIQAADGSLYTALVQEGAGTVEVPAVRALFALVNSGGSAGGYLIATGPFSPTAYEWAGPRRIRLVAADELDELSI